MSTPRAPSARGQGREASGPGGVGRWQGASPGDQESSGPLCPGVEDRHTEKGEDTNDSKPGVENSGVGKSVAEGLTENPIPNGEQIGIWLKDVIINHRKGLQKMYGETEAELHKSLEAPIKKGEEMARKLVTEMGCWGEIAKDLTVLTLYDVAILIDDSDSMISEDDGERKETLIQFVDHITEIYSMVNESGILAMRFMNHAGGKKNWKNKSQDYLDNHTYGGVTRIGTELKKKILDKFVIRNSGQSKPLLVLIVTDGAVEGERKGHLENVILDCVNEREEAGKGFDAVRFQFSRIGNDSGAAKLLEDLGQNSFIEEYTDVFQVEVDFEHPLVDKWFVLRKILLGAIISDWDKLDDHSIEIKDRLADKEKDAGESDSGDD